MGGSESTPMPTPQPRPPSPRFRRAWRTTDWEKSHRDGMVKELRNFKQNDRDFEMRILLNGPVGSGKSSFIWSLNSIFQGRAAAGALAASSAGKSFTLTYKSHYIKNEDSGRLPFVFKDVMGLEKTGGGIHADDIVSALKGHIPDNYMFNPVAALNSTMPGFKANPGLKDRIHCLVSVVAADSISRMSEDVIDQMKSVRAAASRLEIPQVVVMTMADKACELVSRDLKDIYTSKIIKEKMETCSNRLGVPMNCILPVKNYYEEDKLNNDIDVLLLSAMTQIVNFANDYIWNLQQSEEN